MKKTLITFFLCILYTLSYAQAGAIDPSFNPGDLGFGNGDGADNDIQTTALQSDGKIIIGGNFTSYNGTGRNYITRLNADGTLDATFNPGTGPNLPVSTIALQPDGKIIIGGTFTSYNGTGRNYIARLNTDGTLDATFDPGTGAGSYVSTTALQPDGKIIIGGNFTLYNGTVMNRIARLNADGTLDATFNTGTGADNDVYTTALQPDGKIIIGGDFTMYNGTARIRIARLNADGTLDATFNPGTGTSGQVYTTALQSDGKIIIGGNFAVYNGTVSNKIARLNADGTLDVTFNLGTGPDNNVHCTALQPDGKIIIGGIFISYNGTARIRIARLNADGTLDATFDPGAGASDLVFTTALQPDGKIIIVGRFTAYNGTARGRIARLNADGTLDATFNPGTGAIGTVETIETAAIQTDGKIIIGGSFTIYNGTFINRIARLNADGTLDATFTPGTGASSTVRTSALQPDGKIIMGGDFASYNGTGRNRIARLNADGTLDATFNPGTGANNRVLTTALQPDGKIIIGGWFTNYNGAPINRIARLNADGTLDATFNPGTGANNRVHTIALQPDGKIIIGGLFTSYNGTGIIRIARLNADGTLDATFNPGTGADGPVVTTALQPDGKIIIGGWFTNYNGTGINRIARLNADGTLDATFTPGMGASGTVLTSALQPDGKIIIGGLFTSYNGTGRNRIARLNADGTLDATFNPGTGADNYVATTALQPNGKIIIGGIFTSYDGTGRNRIARILGDCTPTTSSFSVSACNSYTVPSGISTYTTSQTVMDTIPNAAGCDSIMTIMITINSLPTVTAMSGAICIGQSYTITPSGASTYTYSSGSAVVTPTATSNYTVAGTDGNGCENSTALTVTVNALPTITVNSGTICAGQSFTMVPSGASTFTYSTGSAVVSPTINTNYTVVGTGTNGCVSVSSATANIVVNANPTITVNSGTVCAGQSFTIIPNGASTYTYSSGSAVVSPTINTNYTVVGTGTNGCISVSSSTSNVTVNSLPTITAMSGAICIGQSYTIMPSGASTYTYSSGSAVVTPTATSNYTVAGTDGNGCENSAALTVSVNSLPTITVNSDDICLGSSFTITPNGATTYTYSSGSNIVSPTSTSSYTVTGTDINGCENIAISSVTVITVSASSAITSSIICYGGVGLVQITATGGDAPYTGVSTYTVLAGNNTFTVTDNNGCLATTTISVPQPSQILTTQSASICAGASFTVGTSTYTATNIYTNILTAANGCDSTVITNLYVYPTITTTQSYTLCAGQSVNVVGSIYSSTGTYTNSIIGANSCTNYIVSSVFVKPAISKTQTISICANSSYQIGTSTYNIAGTYTNVLTAVDGCDSTVYTTLDVKPIFTKIQNIAICVGQTYTIGTSAYTSTGTYTNVLTANNGCDSIVVTVLIVNPLPIVTINTGEICIGNAFTLTANGAVTYTYSSGSNVVSPNATTNYTVLATDINGCKNSAITTVTVNPLPTIDAGDDITLVLGETHQFNPTQTNAVTYTWTTNDGLNNANIINPISSTQTDITYTISVSSAKGCLASDEVSVKIYNEFFINNFVSPNGDGNNDTWKISVPYLVKDCALEIFDQWGTKVFSKANNYENEWDAKNVVDGVYYFLIMDGAKLKHSGSITVLR